MQGVRGVVRTGGDAGRAAASTARRRPRRWSPSIPASSRSGRTARRTISVPVPDFNGTLRLMAMAWTQDGVGHAEKDVLVRDPVVVTASLPHFLAPGDQSRARARPRLGRGRRRDGRRCRSRSSGTAVSVDPSFASRPVELAAGERKQMLVPISRRRGRRRRDHRRADASRRRRAGEDAEPRACALNEPPVATTDFVALAPGAELSVSADRARRARRPAPPRCRSRRAAPAG